MCIDTKVLLSAVLICSALFFPLGVSAGEFDRYKQIIDNFQNYPMQERETALTELEAMKTSDIEKKYLLGMLYFIQGIERMKQIARQQKTKPKIADVLKDSTVQRYLQNAEANYDAVERTSPGYKYIYCKYGELYRYTFNKDGLKRVTNRVGNAVQNDRVLQCKAMLESAAAQFTRYGDRGLEMAKVIFEEAIKTWRPYPKYMLEPLGDIEQLQNNGKRALYWWRRCVEEVEVSEIKQRCQEKIKDPP
ncbi:MAG: hypothetical protein R3268_06330 [Acidiferrobacterales bacterium]|nr:hypothetical protein [Acidiferrobacterales bacterium]